jgi:electron transfer flavoprotein alpha subunit
LKLPQSSKENLLDREDFSILLPEGWQEAETGDTVSAVVINTAEEITDPKAQAINFKTYFAVNHDLLQGAGVAEYAQAFKAQISQMDTTAVFSQERETTVNGQPALAFEVDMMQEEIDFKVLVVVIKGASDDVWILTFNTLENNWAGYINLFSQIINSFKIK